MKPGDLLNIESLQNLNLQLLELTAHSLKVSMPVEGNRNHLGGIYAGAMFSLAEFPFGLLCVQRFSLQKIVPVIGEVTIRFLSPASTVLTVEMHVEESEWLAIEAETLSKGKCKVQREIAIYDELGVQKASVHATYFTLLCEPRPS